MNAPTTPDAMDPASLDRRMRELAFLTAEYNLVELAARWQDFNTRKSPEDVAAILSVAKHWVRCRMAELLDNQVTADGIIGIASVCQNRVGMAQPARLGKTLADATRPDKHQQMDRADAQRLPWVIAALGAPDDMEAVRVPFLYDWLRAATRPPLDDDRATAERAVLDVVTRSAPPDWQQITGTLCAAAGVARANLRVVRPGGTVGISAPVDLPDLHRLRRIDRAAGQPWWRAVVDITADLRAVTPTPANVELPPLDLMRPSEYLAEGEFTGRPLPDWLQTFCDFRILDDTTTLSPAAATEAALIALAVNKVDVDPRRVMIQRHDEGYAVRSATHAVDVADTGGTHITRTTP
ncbi:hypothetical protein QSJ18_13405 [Gordonia sp. ABSL1-1]|uniref:hypothetical protein n=1 Tax=Gordonia sp. ABSL1-1 TaxID=3053923 RepID=UPI002574038B|nr:hypothetical protein [Gordonia sp. ABSL1-1]MDL9937744.1 hypothetical protein [Gordonia sp. ABSL1-1]